MYLPVDRFKREPRVALARDRGVGPAVTEGETQVMTGNASLTRTAIDSESPYGAAFLSS
jgi:hypothetical protein